MGIGLWNALIRLAISRMIISSRVKFIHEIKQQILFTMVLLNLSISNLCMYCVIYHSCFSKQDHVFGDDLSTKDPGRGHMSVKLSDLCI